MEVNKLNDVNIGYVGENGIKSVPFAFSEWVEEVGEGGSISLLVKRSMDSIAYPVILAVEGYVATWNITSTDTAYNGCGIAQLTYAVDEKRKKSAIFGFQVNNSIADSSTPPNPYESWLETLTDLAAETQENAESASRSASDASGFANDASGYADNASGFANDASGYADNAREFAGSARGYVYQANDYAKDAEAWAKGTKGGSEVDPSDSTYHNNSKYYAEQASGSATQAGNSASASAGSASEAEGYKNTTKGYMDTAEGFKDNASSSATSASNSAEDSEAHAKGTRNGVAVGSTDPAYHNNSKYYAEQAREIVDELTIDDELSDTSEHSVQNKVITEALSTKAEVDGAYENFTAGNAEQIISTVLDEDSEIFNYRTSGGSSDIGNRKYLSVTGGSIVWNQQTPDTEAVNTVSGDIVTVTDAKADDAERLVVEFAPQQDLHGQEYPYPAGGRKNKINVQDYSQSFTNIYYIDKGTGFVLTADETYTFSATVDCSINSFTMSVGVGNNGAYRADILTKTNLTSGRVSITFTPTADKLELYNELYFRIPRFGTPQTGTVSVTNIQLELGSTATDYAPYSNICPITGWTGVNAYVSPTLDAQDGTTYPVSWTSQGTMYGGYVDVVSGELVATWGKLTYDGSEDESWKTYNTYNGFYIIEPTMKQGSDLQGGISNWLKRAPWGQTGFRLGSGNNSYIYVIGITNTFDDVSDLETWRTYLDNTPLELIVPLAEPITYQLTPTQVTTLLGENNVWSDAGAVTLDYVSTHKHHTLQSGRKYLTQIGNTASMVAGTGQEVSAECGVDNVHDLTQMFGSAVADHIYSLEQSTTGNGVKYFRSLFPKKHYPYSANRIESVQVASHDVVMFNQWDEEYLEGYYTNTGAFTSNNTQLCTKNKIAVLPNTTYYFKAGSRTEGTNVGGAVCYYDADETFIERVSQTVGTFTTPNNCHFIHVNFGTVYGTTYNHDICINLSWSGYRNGEYEPYRKISYPLDSSLTLRGIPKLVSGKVVYDGDKYEADGTVTRRYGVVDLGTLTYSKSSVVTNGFVATKGMPSNFPVAPNTTYIPNWVCTKYLVTSNVGIEGASIDKYITFRVSNLNKGVIIKDSTYESLYTNNDMASFKTAMSGVYLIYELATPTTEEAEPYQHMQIVDDWGTEEFVDANANRGFSMPVGHDTQYMQNLRDKLQHLPSPTASNGIYLISQTNEEMSLIPYVKELPTAPSSNGTYVLKCTKNGSTVTYSWVAE